MVVPSDRRKYIRLSKSFQTKVRILRTCREVPGTTHDLSQGGAFIISPSWSDFQLHDQTEIELFLPSTFTGQKDTLILKGLSTVKRVDADRGGIAAEFLIELKAFEVFWGYES